METRRGDVSDLDPMPPRKPFDLAASLAWPARQQQLDDVVGLAAQQLTDRMETKDGPLAR